MESTHHSIRLKRTDGPSFLSSKLNVHRLSIQSVLRIGDWSVEIGNFDAISISHCTTARPTQVVPKPSCESGLNSCKQACSSAMLHALIKNDC
ncbi:hypothetical protein P692DRAFT_20832921 [Suillus brevipes Sb2]|nr:hypothetical protein P692DRAFT_20832921 [Suillus brevipes Sb2]